MSNLVKVRVLSYEEGIDVFTLGAFGFQEGDELIDADYTRDAPDFDDFEVPGLVLPALIGEYAEPSEVMRKVYTVPMP